MIEGGSSATRANSRSPARADNRKALRGRAAEQRAIGQLLRSARSGTSGVLLVDGERGIGKSALLQEAVSEAAQQGFSLAVGAGDRLGRHVPFFAFRTAIQAPFGTAADGGHREGPAFLDWQIRALRDRLAQRATVAPLLICLDDMHWASRETLLALRVLPGELARHPVAWILAMARTPQDSGTAAVFKALESEGAQAVGLARLSDQAAAEMLADMLGAPPHEKLLDMATSAAGNPLLLAAMVSGLRDEGGIQIIDGRVQPTSGGLPQRAGRVARSWLDGLTSPTRQMLGAAAVLGGTFRLHDIADILGETPTALLPRLQEALDAGIVTANDDKLSFRHALVADASVGLIPLPARRTLHRQFGEILLNRGESAATAAAHLFEGAEPGEPGSLAGLDRAAARIKQSHPKSAADLALRALEFTSAADPAMPQRAVAAAEALAAAGRPEPAARIAREILARPVQVVAEARIRSALSTALCASGRTQDARAEAERALAVTPELPAEAKDFALAAELQAVDALADDESAGKLSASILASPGRHGGHAITGAITARAAMTWRDGKVGETLDLLRDAARDGMGVSPDARRCQPLLVLAARLIDLRQLDEATAVIRSADNGVLRGMPQEAVLSILHARVHLAGGNLDEAEAEGRSALATSVGLAAHAFAAAAHSVLGAIALRRGDLPAAARYVASCPALLPHIAAVYASVESALIEVQLTEVRDGPAAVIGQIREVCADLPRLRGLLLADPALAGWLVRTALAAGDSEIASTVAATADALDAGNPGHPAVATASAHSRGLLDRDTARLGHAVTSHQDPWARGSAAEDLASLHADRSARAQAVRYLRLALEEYRGAGAAGDLARIRNRLRKLGVRHRHWETSADRPEVGWDSLTGTERAVASLVAQGLTNRQVGGRMYISEHTVAFHLRQAFRKLSIGSRVELARIVVAQAGVPTETGRCLCPAICGYPQGIPDSA